MHWLVALSVVSVILFMAQDSYAESQDTPLIHTTGEIVKIGMDLTKTSIIEGDLDSAKKYSKFTTDFYARQINTLRQANVESADDLHLLLVDIHAKIESNAQPSEILTLR